MSRYLRYGMRVTALVYLTVVAIIAIGRSDWEPLVVVACSMWIAYEAALEGGKA